MGSNLTNIESYRLHNNMPQQDAAILSNVQGLTDRLTLFNKNTTLYNQLYPEKIAYSLDPSFIADDFGTTRFDKRAKYINDFIDPTDLRAREQTALAKATNGIIKGGLETATTLGNLAGLLTEGLFSGFQAMITGQITDINGNTYQLEGNAGNKWLQGFINNPITQLMRQAEDFIEKTIPNYRSHEEQDTAWYKRAFTPGMSMNFWFDDVFKNVGFSAGSLIGGRLLAKGTGALTRTLSRKAYREAFETLGKSVNNKILGSEVKNVLKQYADEGLATALSPEKIKAVGALKHLSRKEDLITTLTGATFGAIGEAQFEAAIAVNDFIEKNTERLDDLMQNNDAYFRTMYNKYLETVKPEDGPVLEYEDFKQSKYEQAKHDIVAQAHKIGNTVFGFEAALLTATNISTFKRFFSGGFRNFKSALVKADIKGVGDQVVDNIGRRVTKNGTLEAYNKINKLQKVAHTLKPMITEGPVEEMGQNFINKASEYYHGSYLNERLNYLLNDEYNQQATNFLSSVGVGLGRSYGDADEWLDGFAGSIMGLAGLPSIHRNKKSVREKDPTKKRFEVSWDSGAYGEWKEIQNLDKLTQAAVDNVNTFLKDPEKIRAFQNTITQIAMDQKMQTSVFNNDVNEFKDAEHTSLMSTIAAFQDAHMNDILDQYVNSAANNLTDEQLEQVKQGMDERIVANKTNDEIRQMIQKESSDIKNLISKYREIYDGIATSYSATHTQSEMHLLTQALSLADYKLDRASQLIKESGDLFNQTNLYEKDGQTLNLTEALNQLTTLLHINDATLDIFNIQSPTGESNITTDQKLLFEQNITQQVYNEMPAAWNQQKKENVFKKIRDAYINIKESIALNNEFAELVNSPQLMHHISKQLFDDHLTEADKQKVTQLVDKLNNTTQAEEAQQILDSIGNNDVKNKVIQKVLKNGSDFIKNYVKEQQEAQHWNQLMDLFHSLPDNLLSEDPQGAQEVRQLLNTFKGLTYREGVRLLNKLRSDNTLTPIQKEFLERLYKQWSVGVGMQQVIQLDQKTEKALKQVFQQGGIFRNTLYDILQKRDKTITFGRNTIGKTLKLGKDGKTSLSIVSDFQNRQTALVYTFTHDDKKYNIRLTLNNDTVVFDSPTMMISSEQSKELLTMFRERCADLKIIEDDQQRILDSLMQVVLQNQTISTPLCKDDIVELEKNASAKKIWNEFLNPELIQLQSQQTQVSQTNTVDTKSQDSTAATKPSVVGVINQELVDTYPRLTPETKAFVERIKMAEWPYTNNGGDLKLDQNVIVQYIVQRGLITTNEDVQQLVNAINEMFRTRNALLADYANQLEGIDILLKDKLPQTTSNQIHQQQEHLTDTVKSKIQQLADLFDDVTTTTVVNKTAKITTLDSLNIELKNVQSQIDDYLKQNRITQAQWNHLNQINQQLISNVELEKSNTVVAQEEEQMQQQFDQVAVNITTYDSSSFSEEDWTNIRSTTDAHKSTRQRSLATTNEVRKKRDAVIYQYLSTKGAFQFVDNGGLFTHNLFHYTTDTGAVITFKDLKQRERDIFDNEKFENEPVIGMYVTLNDGSEQLIGIVNAKEVTFIKQIQDSNYQIKAKIKSFNASQSIYLYNTDITDVATQEVLPATLNPLKDVMNQSLAEEHQLASPPVKKQLSDIVLMFTNDRQEVFCNKVNLPVVQQIKKDLQTGKRNFKSGEVYILMNPGDNFEKNADGSVNYTEFALAPVPIKQLIDQDNVVGIKLTNLIDRLSRATQLSPEEFKTLQLDLKDALVQHDPTYENYTFNFNLIRASNNGDISIRVESTNRLTEETTLLARLNLTDNTTTSDVRNFLFEQNLDPILNFTTNTWNLNNESSYITLQDMVDCDALLTPLERLTPVNAAFTVELIPQNTSSNSKPSMVQNITNQNVESQFEPTQMSMEAKRNLVQQKINESRTQILNIFNSLQSVKEFHWNTPLCLFGNKSMTLNELTLFTNVVTKSILNRTFPNLRNHLELQNQLEKVWDLAHLDATNDEHVNKAIEQLKC